MKAVFLDRDGTINIEKHYLYKIEEFEFVTGVLEGLKLLQQMGYSLVIVTNQSGIGRGYYSEDDFLKLNNWMLLSLEESGIHVEKVYYCPHLPDAKIEEYRVECNCRKPALGMYEEAIREFDIDLSQSFAVGDKLRDCSICESTACRGFLIGSNEKEEIIQQVKQKQIERVEYAADLYECAVRIQELRKLEEKQ